MSDALVYYFRVATNEVKEFVKPEILKKIAVESEGILYSKSRVMDGQRFTLSGDMQDSSILLSIYRFVSAIQDNNCSTAIVCTGASS